MTSLDPMVTIELYVAGGAILSALIAGLIGSGGSVAAVLLTNRRLRKERAEDRAERQKVAERAEEMARLLKASTARVEESAKDNKKQLSEIHTLVNSNLTTEKKLRMESIGRELLMMQKMIQMAHAQGIEPSAAECEAVESTKAALVELQSVLMDRARQAEIVASDQRN
jgi:hypothetical protein